MSKRLQAKLCGCVPPKFLDRGSTSRKFSGQIIFVTISRLRTPIASDYACVRTCAMVCSRPRMIICLSLSLSLSEPGNARREADSNARAHTFLRSRRQPDGPACIIGETFPVEDQSDFRIAWRSNSTCKCFLDAFFSRASRLQRPVRSLDAASVSVEQVPRRSYLFDTLLVQ